VRERIAPPPSCFHALLVPVAAAVSAAERRSSNLEGDRLSSKVCRGIFSGGQGISPHLAIFADNVRNRHTLVCVLINMYFDDF
jgi:hypothetical protein